MQANTITIGEKVYDRFQEYPDRSVYTAPDHSISRAHILSLSRVVPTTTGATARSRAKFVRDVEDAVSGKTGTIFVTVEVSQPVWADPADVTAEVLAADLFVSSTEFQSLIHKQSI